MERDSDLHKRQFHARPRLQNAYPGNEPHSSREEHIPLHSPSPEIEHFHNYRDLMHATLRRYNANFGDTPFETKANQIVQDLQKNRALMEDSPTSNQLRADALRVQPVSLSIKRSVKEKLSSTVSRTRNNRSIGCWTTLKYRTSVRYTKCKDSVKIVFARFQLWNETLKQISGNFGSGYASYFQFFRWLFVLNFFTAILSFVFVVLPVIVHDTNDSESLALEAFQFQDIFLGTGSFRDTILCYGHYTNSSIHLFRKTYYHIPAAYFATIVLLYLLAFVVLSISAARSYRKSFIETKGGLTNAYAMRIFSGWDFGIADKEAAQLKSISIYHELKELLSDEIKHREKRTFGQLFYTRSVQLSANILILSSIAAIGWGIWKLLEKYAFTSSNNIILIAIIVNLVIMVCPSIFSAISTYEDYQNPRTRLNISLFRAFLLGATLIGVILNFWIINAAQLTCWETYLAQEIYRLIVFDFIIAAILTPLVETIYFLTKRVLKREKPQFDISAFTLQLVYNQSLLWAGFMYSPMLPLLVTLKMAMLWYVREWMLRMVYGPPKKSFRAAQTQTWFKVMTLFSVLMIVVAHAYTMKNIRVSSGCGPFRNYAFIYEIVTNNFQRSNNWFLVGLGFVARPGVVAFLMVFLGIVVYYTKQLAVIEMMRVEMLREMIAMQAKDKKYLLNLVNRLGGERCLNFRDDGGRNWGKNQEIENWRNGRDSDYERTMRNEYNEKKHASNSNDELEARLRNFNNYQN